MGRPKGSKNKSTLEKLALLGQPKAVPVPVPVTFTPFGTEAPVTSLTKADVQILTAVVPVQIPLIPTATPTPILSIKESRAAAERAVDAPLKLLVPADVLPIAETAYQDTLREVSEMVKHFRAEGYVLPDRLKNKLLAIKTGQTCDAISILKKKALDSVHLNFCYQWSKEVIPGAVLKHLARPKGAEWGDKESEKDG